MGLLKKIFKGKEENVHFERDSRGRVTSVERSGDVRTVSGNGETYTRGATPVSDRLIPSRSRKPSIRKRAADVAKRIDKGIIDYNRRQSRRPSRRRSYGTNYSTHQNYNPFGSMFDTGLGNKKSYKSKTSGSKTKYTVIGGKAYPIAGSGKKKKKKKSTGLGSYDMVDNWGFFK